MSLRVWMQRSWLAFTALFVMTHVAMGITSVDPTSKIIPPVKNSVRKKNIEAAEALARQKQGEIWDEPCACNQIVCTCGGVAPSK